jgi:hypothetical protein
MDQSLKRPGLPGRFLFGFQLFSSHWNQWVPGALSTWAEFHVFDFSTLTVIPAC